MRARCQRCQTEFSIDSFGRHTCPGCGLEVEVSAPEANPYAAPNANGLPPPLPPPVAESDGFLPTPWERRSELGQARAIKETVMAVLGSPQEFVRRTDWSRDDGLLTLFFWVSIVPQMLGVMLGWLLNNPLDQLQETRTLLDEMGEGQEFGDFMQQMMPMLEFLGGPLMLAGTLLFMPLFALLSLYVMAGVTHLVLLALGRATGGWTATFKVFVYASCTNVLSILPSCGALIALTWGAVLQILGLAPAHRTTIGGAVAGVVGMHLVFLFCLCGVPTMLLVAALIAGS